MQTRCPADLAVRFEQQRKAFAREPAPLLARRISRLERLRALLDANETALVHTRRLFRRTLGARDATRLAGPFEAPRVDPALFDDPRDLDNMAAGFKPTRKLMQAPALAQWATRDAFAWHMSADAKIASPRP
ncbi:hypothetical protein QZM51_14820 [Burkholderia orbicola]|nr:hypothetical protein [Burkholderia orbicola]MDN7580485.1 hypothetical protein [Burkholderia orbicola]